MDSSRQLAVIVFTDVVGYTALMGENAQKALDLIASSQSIQRPLVEKHHGKWLKEMGDGVLMQFDTALDAVNCAIEIQEKARFDFDGKLRIGIHLGDITIVEREVYGDGVNVASRLEAIADPGGIYISDAVLKSIQGQRDLQTKYLGEISLKNVAYKLRTYAIQGEGLPAPAEVDSPSNTASGIDRSRSRWPLIALLSLGVGMVVYLSLRSDPRMRSSTEQVAELSIAVLPFRNFSGMQDLEPFCDGMTDAVITRLAKLEGIEKVISRTTMMRFKETDLSIPEIADQLGVTYILESSFQRSGDQIKITLQLIDGPTDNPYWADEILGLWGDIFGIQAEVAENVALNMGAQISDREIAVISEAPTANSEAYELYLQANWDSNYEVDESIVLLEKAIQLDPNFADAYALLGFLKSQYWWFGDSKMNTSEEAFDTGMFYYQKALDLDPENPTALYNSISSLLLYRWDFEEAARKREVLKRVKPDVNDIAHLLPMGEFQEALEIVETNLETDPFSIGWSDKILCYYFNGMMDECLQAVKDAPKGQSSHLDMDITRVYLYFKMYDKALAILDQFSKINVGLKDKPRPLAFRAVASFHLGIPDQVLPILNVLEAENEKSSAGSPFFFIAMIYAQMGEVDLAFEWLHKVYEAREVEMYWLMVEPLFEPLHNDSRWLEILNKIGFPT